jgi:hypothetical protein
MGSLKSETWCSVCGSNLDRQGKCPKGHTEGFYHARLWERNYNIPTTYVSSLGLELEIPVVEAVETLWKERPWSSGFHTRLNQRWTIVFQGNISNKAMKAAKAAGLQVSYRGDFGLTDVSLPNVGVYEFEKATSVFNKFAELYKREPSGFGDKWCPVCASDLDTHGICINNPEHRANPL